MQNVIVEGEGRLDLEALEDRSRSLWEMEQAVFNLTLQCHRYGVSLEFERNREAGVLRWLFRHRR